MRGSNRCIAALGVCLVLAGAAQADHIDFDTPGELQSNFRQNGNTNYFEAPGLGIGNGRAVDVGSFDGTAIYTGRTFDLNSSGKQATVSMMVYRDDRSASTWLLEVGLTASESYQLTGTNAYVALRLDSYNPNKYKLFSYSANGSQQQSFEEDTNITLQDDHWYLLTATFKNLGNNQIKISGQVEDFGTTGLASAGIRSQLGSRVYNNAVIAADSTLSAGFRGISTAGSDRMDEFTVVPEPTSMALMLGGLAAAIRRRRA